MSKQLKITDDSAQIRAGISKFPWLRITFFIIVCFAILFPFTKTGKDVVSTFKRQQAQNDRDFHASRNPKPAPKPIATPPKPKPAEPKTDPKPAPKPKPITPKRIPVIAIKSDQDIRYTVRGFTLGYKANFKPGDLASTERKRKDSYVAQFSLDIKTPKAATKMSQLQAINPHLPKMLPGLAALMEEGKISPFYNTLYNNKAKRLKDVLLRLDKVLTQHNYFDCETMLELTHPKTKRKVFLFQADMDVVTDGSDGDRLSVMPDEVVNSTYYQPFTSYGWDKVTKTPNPMIAGWQQRAKKAREEIARASTGRERKNWLRSRLKMLERGIADMKRRSFLIAEHDPFIVISINQLTANRRYTHAPRVGDYVAVIYGNKIYPAIVGDGGPSFKAGESSLRLARTINPAASSINRPVSDLSVTYLVFPGSANKKKSAPNYKKWRESCAKLIDEIGGIGQGYELHQWENTLPTAPTEPGIIPTPEGE